MNDTGYEGVVRLVRNDSYPEFYILVYDKWFEESVDLTDYNVFAKFRQKGTTTVLFTTLLTAVDKYYGLYKLTLPDDALLDATLGRYDLEVFVSKIATADEGVVLYVDSISQADPAVITLELAIDNTLAVGDHFVMMEAGGMTSLNSQEFIVSKATDASQDTIEFTDVDGNEIDSTDLDAYSGRAVLYPIRKTQTALDKIKFKIVEDF